MNIAAHTASTPVGPPDISPTRAGRVPGAAVRAQVDPEAPQAVRYYAWELPVRICHWLVVASLAVLSVTGIYLGRPFLAVAGEARATFVMGTMRAVHFFAAIVFTLSVLARLVWMFRGNAFARWHQFVPVSRARRRELVQTLRFYLFLDRDIPPCGGHNPLAGLAYLAVFALYLVMIVTGLALYGSSAHVDSPLRVFAAFAPWIGGLQTARLVHHVVMWLLLAFAVHHVYSAVMVAIVEKNSTIDSIVTGYRSCPRMPHAGPDPDRSAEVP